MSSEFVPNIVLFGDRPGFGRWLIGHARQHLNYIAAFAAQSPSIVLSDHPLMRFGESPLEQKFWLQDHSVVHQEIRGYLGIDGIDLAEVDFTKPDQFQSWLDDHGSEHETIDQALGLT